MIGDIGRFRACVRQVRRNAAIASGVARRWYPATMGAPPSELARRCTAATGGDPANHDDARATAHGGSRAIPWRQVGRSALIASGVARCWSPATIGVPPGELARRCASAAGGDPATPDDARATVHGGTRAIPWQRYQVSSKFSRYRVPSVQSSLHDLKFSRSYSAFVPFKKVDKGYAVLTVSYIPSFMYLASLADPLWNPVSKWPNSKSGFTTHNLYLSHSDVPDCYSVDVESNYMEYVESNYMDYVNFRTDLIRWNYDLDELRRFWSDGNLDDGDRSNFHHYYCQFCEYGNELTFEHIHYVDNVRVMFRRIEPFLKRIPRGSFIRMSDFPTYLPFDCKVNLMRVDFSRALWVKEIFVYHTLDGHWLHKNGVCFGGYNTNSKEWTAYLAEKGHNREFVIYLPEICVNGSASLRKSDILPVVNSTETLPESDNETVNVEETLPGSDEETGKIEG